MIICGGNTKKVSRTSQTPVVMETVMGPRTVYLAKIEQGCRGLWQHIRSGLCLISWPMVARQ
jgi:hypothetical protein